MTSKDVLLSILYVVVIVIFLFLFDLLFQAFINHLIFEIFNWFNDLSFGWKLLILFLGGMSVIGMLLWGISFIGYVLNLYVFSHFPDNRFTNVSGMLLSIANSIVLLVTLWQVPSSFNFWIVIELLFISIFIVSFIDVVRIDRKRRLSFGSGKKILKPENDMLAPVSQEPIRLVHASRYALYRTAVRNGFSVRPRIEIIGEAEDGAQLLDLLRRSQPDVVLMDISLPIINGQQALIAIKSNYPQLKVIILTIHNDQSMINKMFELGATAYLTLDNGTEEIYEAIVQCFEKGYYNGSLLRKEIMKNNNPWSLNEKEVSILRLMGEKKTVEEIGETVDLSPRTVKAIVDKLISKAECKSDDELVDIAREGVDLTRGGHITISITPSIIECKHHVGKMETEFLNYTKTDEGNRRITFEIFTKENKIQIGYAEGYLNNDGLITVISLSDGYQKLGIGKKAFLHIIEFMGGISAIKYLIGSWHSGGEFNHLENNRSTNLSLFQQNLAKDMSPEEAAKETPTGKWAVSLGYIHVTVSKMSDDEAMVLFTKPG